MISVKIVSLISEERAVDAPLCVIPDIALKRCVQPVHLLKSPPIQCPAWILIFLPDK